MAVFYSTQDGAIASASAAPEIDPSGDDATRTGQRLAPARVLTHFPGADDLQVIALALAAALALYVIRQRSTSTAELCLCGIRFA